MGMSHRGRLNVLAQVTKRQLEEIFAGFEDVDPRSVLGSGDVKYHMGATGQYATRSGGQVRYSSGLESELILKPLTLSPSAAPAPSCVTASAKEVVRNTSPLLVRRRRRFRRAGEFSPRPRTTPTCPARLHASAGTIHVVGDNLLRLYHQLYRGTPRPASPPASPAARRSRFSTSMEKDVDAVVRSARKAAVEYRQEFGNDVVIDDRLPPPRPQRGR